MACAQAQEDLADTFAVDAVAVGELLKRHTGAAFGVEALEGVAVPSRHSGELPDPSNTASVARFLPLAAGFGEDLGDAGGGDAAGFSEFAERRAGEAATLEV